MGIALPETEAGKDDRSRATRGWLVRHPGLFVLCAYLAAAVALNWRLWLGLGTMSAVGDPGPADNDLMAFFLRYTADAIAHGHLPALVTTALNAPNGISLMWNTSVLFPAVALTPVTLLGGPLASLTVFATLGYAGSAAAMYWVLRRHGASVLAGTLGGAVFGFSPGMVNAGIAHYQIQFAVLVPLMIEAVLSIITGRGSPLLAGAWLGVLAAAQLFTGEEMISNVAIASLVLVAVLAVSRPSAVLARLRGTVVGLGVAAAVALLLCAHALWTQFHGPLTEDGSPWLIAQHGNGLGAFVNPQAQLLFHTASSAAYAASHGADAAEYLAYLGPPLLILVAGVAIRYWRDLRVRAAAVTWAVLEALSLGVNGPALPFHWLQGLPLLGDMLPSRLSITADGAAAAVLAFGLDLALSSAPRAAGPPRRGVPAPCRAPRRAAAPRRAGGGRAARGPAAGAASGGRGHRIAGAGRLGRRVRAPAAAGERERARRARPLLAAGRGDALAGRHRPAGRSGRGLVHRPPSFRPRCALLLGAGRHPCHRAVPRRAMAGRRRRPRLRHGRAGGAQLLAPGRRCGGHQPGRTAWAVPHRDSRPARHPGRAGARLAERVSQGGNPATSIVFSPMGGRSTGGTLNACR